MIRIIVTSFKRGIYALALVGLLAGCQTMTAQDRAASANITIIGNICAANWMQTIRYSGKLDSKPTKDQVRRFNAGRASFCSNG